MAKAVCEQEYDFALVLSGVTELTPEIEDALFSAGCDDATLSRRFGRVYLTFSRQAASYKDAIFSAIRDVRKAGADVLRVDACDLVTQADIARRCQRSRQNIHQYITGERGPAGFPPPVCHISDDSPLWAWCEVAYWLRQNDMIKEDVLRDAQEAAIINTVLELEHQRRVAPRLAKEVLRSVGCLVCE